jgi:hypothetical protein
LPAARETLNWLTAARLDSLHNCTPTFGSALKHIKESDTPARLETPPVVAIAAAAAAAAADSRLDSCQLLLLL